MHLIFFFFVCVIQYNCVKSQYVRIKKFIYIMCTAMFAIYVDDLSLDLAMFKFGYYIDDLCMLCTQMIFAFWPLVLLACNEY